MHGYKGFFFVVKTFKITLFQLSTMQFSVINWGHSAIYYIPELSYFVAESLCLLSPFTHFAFPPPPALTTTRQSVLCIIELENILRWIFFFFPKRFYLAKTGNNQRHHTLQFQFSSCNSLSNKSFPSL